MMREQLKNEAKVQTVSFQNALEDYKNPSETFIAPRASMIKPSTVTEKLLRQVADSGELDTDIEYSMMPYFDKNGMFTASNLFHSGSKNSTDPYDIHEGDRINDPAYFSAEAFQSRGVELETYKHARWTAHWHTKEDFLGHRHCPSISDYSIAARYDHFSIVFDELGAIVYFPSKDFSEDDISNFKDDAYTYIDDTRNAEQTRSLIEAEGRYMREEFPQKYGFISSDVRWGSDDMQKLVDVMSGKIDELKARKHFWDK